MYNQHLAILLILPLLILITVFLLIMRKGFGSGLERVMERIAEKRNGIIRRSLIFPSLFISLDGAELLARFRMRWWRKYDPFQFIVDGRCNKRLGCSISIYPESIILKAGKKLGLKDIETGNDEFDRKFLLRSDDEDLALGFLDRDLQEKILRISHLLPSIKIKDNRLRITTSSHLVGREENMDSLIDTAISILDRIKSIGS